VSTMPRKKKVPKKLKQEFIKAIKTREYLLDNGQSILLVKFPDGTGTVLMRVPSDKGVAKWDRVVRQKNYLKKIDPKADGSIEDKINKIVG
jgi:hypothetical protein